VSEKYKDALHAAQDELARLEARRVVLLQLIETLKTLSQSNTYELEPPPGYEPEGLTQEIRMIMGLTTAHLSATQIRDSLIQRGFKTSNPKNFLISVHTVLGRIEDELDVITRDGKPAYKGKRMPVSGIYKAVADALALAAINEAEAHIRAAKSLPPDLDTPKKK
jgi:hypothetical protein